MRNILEAFIKIAENEKITITSLESKIGASKGVLSRAINNKTDIQTKWLSSLVENYPQYSKEWLLTGNGEMLVEPPVQVFNKIKDGLVPDIQNIPFYDLEAAAGIVSLFNDQHNNAVDHIHVPGIPKCDGAIKVSGDSMYPLLKSGDIVLYKQINDPQHCIYLFGEMYIISIDQGGDEHVLVKYIQKSEKKDGWVKLVSQNQKNEPIDVPISSIKALAVVKASIRINSMQ